MGIGFGGMGIGVKRAILAIFGLKLIPIAPKPALIKVPAARCVELELGWELAELRAEVGGGSGEG